jgi:hypothetical protein
MKVSAKNVIQENTTLVRYSEPMAARMSAETGMSMASEMRPMVRTRLIEEDSGTGRLTNRVTKDIVHFVVRCSRVILERVDDHCG